MSKMNNFSKNKSNEMKVSGMVKPVSTAPPADKERGPKILDDNNNIVYYRDKYKRHCWGKNTRQSFQVLNKQENRLDFLHLIPPNKPVEDYVGDFPFKVGDKIRVVTGTVAPNSKKQAAHTPEEEWQSLAGIPSQAHSWIEVENKNGNVYNFGLTYDPVTADNSISSPDITLNVCRGKLKKCLDSQERGEVYTNKNKTLKINSDEDGGCRYVCNNIDTYSDAYKNKWTGQSTRVPQKTVSNYTPNFKVRYRGTMRRVHFEIIKKLFDNSTAQMYNYDKVINGLEEPKYSLSVTIPTKYEVFATLPTWLLPVAAGAESSLAFSRDPNYREQVSRDHLEVGPRLQVQALDLGTRGALGISGMVKDQLPDLRPQTVREVSANLARVTQHIGSVTGHGSEQLEQISRSAREGIEKAKKSQSILKEDPEELLKKWRNGKPELVANCQSFANDFIHEPLKLFSILNNGETFRYFIKGQITEKENIVLKMDELKQKEIAKLRWYNLSLRMKEAKVSSEMSQLNNEYNSLTKEKENIRKSLTGNNRTRRRKARRGRTANITKRQREILLDKFRLKKNVKAEKAKTLNKTLKLKNTNKQIRKYFNNATNQPKKNIRKLTKLINKNKKQNN